MTWMNNDYYTIFIVETYNAVNVQRTTQILGGSGAIQYNSNNNSDNNNYNNPTP